MALQSNHEMQRREIVDLLCDALDEHDADGSDLAALVHDANAVVEDLKPVSDPTWVGNLQNELGVLREVLDGVTASGEWALSGLDLDRVSRGTRSMRFLAGAYPTA